MTSYSGLSRKESWYASLQSNILKPHGRNHHAMLMISFGGAAVDTLKQWIGSIPVASFKDQLDATEEYRKDRISRPLISFFLAASGYRYLGFADKEMPSDISFQSGLKKASSRLGGEAVQDWEDAYQKNIDAVLVISDDDLNVVNDLIDKFKGEMQQAIGKNAVVKLERGETIRDEAGFSREPFGFRDGISNPYFLEEDISKHVGNDSSKFNARAPKEIAILPDPAFPAEYGSYVVISKLEQNVKGFRKAEAELAKALDLHKAELAGGLIIGRTRDGVPIAASDAAQDATKEMLMKNDWNFGSDSGGAKCPFSSHVRKVNDRGESMRTGSGFGDEKFRRITRRGFTYKENGTTQPTNLRAESTDAEDLPEKGIGTLFMSFQSSITDQFEHILTRNVNNINYFTAGTGVDSLIGKRDANDAVAKWPRNGSSPLQFVPFKLDKFVHLKGGEYFFAPSIPFLRSLRKEPAATSQHRTGTPSTRRTARLREEVVKRAFTNRKDEWFTDDMLTNVVKTYPNAAQRPVIIRQAWACVEMLKAMTNKEYSKKTGTFEILDGELIVGTIPMGSVGLGKTFPKYLTDEEARAASLTNRDEGSVFAHTIPNFRRVLDMGLLGVIEFCEQRQAQGNQSQKDFYESVIICCKAVIDYAKEFSNLAKAKAEKESDAARKNELLRIAEVCENVPARPAKTFQEALQCVWFTHLAETAFCAFNSLGRLDQVLNPYLEKDLKDGSITREQAIELIECFLVKGAQRINLNPTTLKDQDFLTFGTGIGTQPIYLDQIASCNNFIQNIMLGGVNKDGSDATNEATYLFLEAVGGIGLCSPTTNIRVHKSTPKALLDAIDKAFRRAGSGHPILFNDESVIPGLVDGGLPLEEARDFAVAGCWEPMLHGKNSFIFGMVNMLRVVECALNEGTLFSTDAQFLKGQKQSWRSPRANDYTSFEQLMSEVKRHMEFFADKIALGTCSFYIFPSAVTPTPFMSMLLDGCLERGVDQSLGGADYNIISNLAFAVPNAANALANIKKYVFEQKRWTLKEVADALRANWGLAPVRNEYESLPESDEQTKNKYFEMRQAFLAEGPKFGNNDKYVDDIARTIMDHWYGSCKTAEKLARKTFLSPPDDQEAASLRMIANYTGPSLKEALRPDFEIHFTSGSGTFGQYSSMGKGVSASADGRAANDSLVPNCSPMAGSAINGLSGLFDTLNSLDLTRFGCAVVTDIRIDGVHQRPAYFADLVKEWKEKGGSMLTVSVLSTSDVLEMLRISDRVRVDPKQIGSLEPYADYFCRVGGWNSCFVCLPRPQQRDHLLRATF